MVNCFSVSRNKAVDWMNCVSEMVTDVLIGQLILDSRNKADDWMNCISENVTDMLIGIL